MQKTIKLLAVITICLLAATGCGGGAANSANPKQVVVTFFEKLSKKDIDGARQLATKDTEPVLNMMKTALEMSEKFKGMGGEEGAKDDMEKDFKNVEFGEAKINGDNAVVPVKDTDDKYEFEIPVRKESGAWKVDFSINTISKMKKKNTVTGEEENIQDMDPEQMKKGLEMADSLMRNMDPEQLKKMQEAMKELGEQK